MNEYLNMLLEYKQTEAALRKRIAELGGRLKTASESTEQENLSRRKLLLEQELYDILEVMDKLYEYADCGVNKKCRNA